jgi:hypothetical protein
VCVCVCVWMNSITIANCYVYAVEIYDIIEHFISFSLLSDP